MRIHKPNKFVSIWTLDSVRMLGIRKGFYGKGVLSKMFTLLEISFDAPRVWKTQENPTISNDLKILKISPAKKTPFVMTLFSGFSARIRKFKVW